VRLPRGALGDTTTRVMWAVLDGRRMYGELMAVTGLSRVTLHQHLHRLKDEGLVTWEPGKLGTLRPLVSVVR
jgi:DNA-binding HxlR family transcriptional regulator